MCVVEYYCGAERVDDYVSGRIDSEPSGSYADYVTEVAIGLDVLTAPIRGIEANPVLSAGETAPSIAAPSSPEGVQSLAGVLADHGFGEQPEGLFAPVFSYCRIGDGGPIEVDTTVAEPLQPSFAWTPLFPEFDIVGASQGLADELERTIQGHLPQMRTIPPIDAGVTIVKFPMWLWLHEPFTGTQLVAESGLGTIRVQGRATFQSVTWMMGDTPVTCTLDDMKAWDPGTGDQLERLEDRPKCHHIFTAHETYTPTATVTYLIEQDIATIPTPGYPWPAPNWQTHPTTPTVDVTSTGQSTDVESIYSVVVAPDYEQGD